MNEQGAEQETSGRGQTTTGQQGTGFNLTPAEVRERWVAALRSGKYRRGTAHLHYKENGRSKFCCLGVLCDVLVKAGMEIKVARRGDIMMYDGDSGTLPDSVVKASGLANDIGELTKPVEFKQRGEMTETDELTVVNDEAGWSFRKIADLIESGGVKTTDGRPGA